MPHDTLIRLRPRGDTLFVHQNRTVLATGRDGFIDGGACCGLFVQQTRLLSRYRYRVDGEAPLPVALSAVEPHTWLGYYLLPVLRTPEGAAGGTGGRVGAPGAAQHAVELKLSRSVGDGLHEDVDVTNFTQEPVTLRLTLEVDADFADQEEAPGSRRQQGERTREWREVDGSAWELRFDYRIEHAYDRQGNTGTARLHRGAILQLTRADSVPQHEDGVVAFELSLPPRGHWHACVALLPVIDGRRLTPGRGCRPFGLVQGGYDEKREAFLAEATGFRSRESETSAPIVIGALRQAEKDLAALRLYDFDHGERAWTLSAGIPIYVALFGRDVLTAAWQAALAGREPMRGSLRELSRWQGTEVNDWRDEQPGRMLHEAQFGPLALLNLIPLGRYYGSVTTSAFYPVVLGELWHWTGNKELVLPFVEPALRGLRWLDEDGDSDRDGFYEYESRSAQGVKNQAWKDSGDAIVYPDGSQVKPPIATCEEQGFVYIAKFLMAELLWWLDRKDDARRLSAEAGELKRRFNQAFWMEDEGFFALGLDSRKRQIGSITSNPGHCIATGIVDESRVRRTVGRLFADDLFTGWGIRTLSSRHPAYNPYSYHRGTVWPVEQATFALGLYRYGLHRHMHLLCRAQFEAAGLFDFYRLPECFTGHPRDAEHPFPAIYPNANSPQAWSSSAVFCFLQAMLGLYPYAPLSLLFVDPQLPDWLPEITLTGLKVGSACASLRFYRQRNGSSDYEVLDQRGTLRVLRQPSPWSLTAGAGERAEDFLLSLAPGR